MEGEQKKHYYTQYERMCMLKCVVSCIKTAAVQLHKPCDACEGQFRVSGTQNDGFMRRLVQDSVVAVSFSSLFSITFRLCFLARSLASLLNLLLSLPDLLRGEDDIGSHFIAIVYIIVGKQGFHIVQIFILS